MFASPKPFRGTAAALGARWRCSPGQCCAAGGTACTGTASSTTRHSTPERFMAVQRCSDAATQRSGAKQRSNWTQRRAAQPSQELPRHTRHAGRGRCLIYSGRVPARRHAERVSGSRRDVHTETIPSRRIPTHSTTKIVRNAVAALQRRNFAG